MEEKFIHVYISGDQHKARFRKLEKALKSVNGQIAVLSMEIIGLGIMAYFQQKELERLKREKEDERAE